MSKALVVATAAASIFTQAARASHRRIPLGLQLASRALVFRTQGELLFGCILLYYFRVFERQHGSAKYGSFVCAATSASYLAAYGAGRLLGAPAAAIATGPFSVIFACIVHFVFDIPATSRFAVMGVRMTDKVRRAGEPAARGPRSVPGGCWRPAAHACATRPARRRLQCRGGRQQLQQRRALSPPAPPPCCCPAQTFVYLAALQLLLSGGRRSMLAGGCGIVAGLLYRLNFCRVKQWRLPASIVRFLSSTLGTEPRPAAQPGSAAGQGAGGPARGAPRPAPQQPAAPRLPQASAEAVQQLVAMGFEHQQAARALQQTNNDVQAAIGLLL